MVGLADKPSQDLATVRLLAGQSLVLPPSYSMASYSMAFVIHHNDT
jgi:hypothetical protein